MGVLSGYKIIELAGLGPCPMAGMLLADMGAEVIVIDRGGKSQLGVPQLDAMMQHDVSRRGKKSIAVNLKSDEGRELVLKLVSEADALIEGFRPGVTEKLGLGPEHCAAVNSKLVYGRMTGWGQTGPLSKTAGHDINYISLNGVLHAIGVNGEKPVLPLNLVGDFGGGTMFLVTGVLAAMLEAQKSGKGQVVDAAMVDGAANLMWMCHSFANANCWNAQERGANLLDGGAFFYDTYECSDGKYVAIGSIEPQFFALLVELCELDQTVFTPESQTDYERWPELKNRLADVIRKKTRSEWEKIFEGTDACFSPVLNFEEAMGCSHNVERNAYIEVEGEIHPAPAPRFDRTPSRVRHGQHRAGEDTVLVMQQLGYTQKAIDEMLGSGAVSIALEKVSG